MIIDAIYDFILDRKDDEWFPECYDARVFRRLLSECGSVADEIAAAMDGGTNDDVRRALCNYIDAQGYDPAIKDYINAGEWVTD